VSGHFWVSLLMALLAASVCAAMPEVTVPMCSVAPVIDGTIAPGEWDGAAGLGCFSVLGGAAAPDQPQVYVTYDAENLYMAARLPLAPGRKPKDTATERDGLVWQDDALEMFLDPTGRRGSYYQLIVNARGTQYDGMKQSAKWDADWESRTQVGDGDWTLEMAVPFASLAAAKPNDGQTWAINFAWDRYTPVRYTACWAPVTQGLHNPAQFGTLTFSSQAPSVALFGPYVRPGGGLELRGRWGPGAAPLQAEVTVSRLDGAKMETVATAKQSGGQTRNELTLPVDFPKEQGSNAPGAYRLTGHVKNGAQVLWAANVDTTVKAPLDMQVAKYWLAGRLVVKLDARGLGPTPQTVEAAVRLSDADAATVAQAAAVEFSADGKAEVTLDVSGLQAGTYGLSAEARAPDGNVLYVATAALNKPPRPHWLGSTAGISDAVLPPWTPLRASGNKVMPWGRTYAFGPLPFPSSVITRGTEVLAGPITLTGSAAGKPIAWSGRNCAVTSAKPHLMQLSGSAKSGALTCEGTISLEYDGMVRSDFRIVPDGEVAVESLALEMPVTPQYGKYLYSWPGGWGSAHNARALPKDGCHGPFKPFLWLGDEWRGLCWFSESDRNFFNDENANVIDIEREGDAVLLRVNIITTPQRISRPLDYTFGFQATPVKPMTPDAWDYRIGGAADYGIEDRVYAKSARITYPAEGHVDLKQGTFECWVRPQFNPSPEFDPKDPSRGTLNRYMLNMSLGNDCDVFFYWNIDDRSMRLYYRHGRTHPLLLATRSKWEEGEWHHVAFTWGEATRVYLDGKMAAEKSWEGLLPGDPANAQITLGMSPCEMDIDEVRISSVPRDSFDLTQAPQADESTLLLDHMDESFPPDGRKKTSPAVGTGGTVTGGGFGDGRFGRALLVPVETRKTTYLEYLRECGVRTLKFHEHWTPIQAYPCTTYGDKLHKLVEGCHQHGLQILLYYGYLMSNIAPEWDDYHDEFLVQPRGGDYHRSPDQWAYVVCYNSAWQDFIADGLDKQMTEFGTDGVYLDGTSEPWGCMNLYHGCGYIRPDGTVGRTYPFFAVRNLMKRIYTIVKKHNPNGQVDVHQSTCMTIPTLSFATTYLDGEQFQGIDRGPFPLDVLPLEAFRCEFMGHNWGVPAEFLCASRAYTRDEAMSFTLLHDVMTRGGLEEQTRLWPAMEEFGRKEATWLPYWENEEYVRTNSPDIKVSLYNRPGRGVMAVISNLGREEHVARVTLDLARLQQPRKLIAHDVLRQEDVPLQRGRLTVPLQSMGHTVIRLRPE